MAHDPIYNLLHTRVRYDLDGLNSETSGWIAAEDADNFDVNWGTVFRIRARISESAGYGGNNAGMKWQFNRESAGWVDVNTHDHATTITAVSAVSSENFSDNDVVNTQFLTSGSSSFINGEGDTTGDFDIDVDNGETEIEGAFIFHNYYDDGNGNSDGDSFEFRVVESDGTVFGGTDNTVTITLNTIDYYIGSTYPETIGRCFAVDDDKNLYMFVDITEGNPKAGMLKSSDGGKSWVLQDNANRPTRQDAEAVDMVLANDRLYIAYVNAGDETSHCVFRVSTHSTNPDTWELIDEALTSGVSKNQNPQTTAIERFDNGDLVIFYMRDNGTDDSGYYQINTGTWGAEQTLDDEASHFFKGVTCVKDTNNLVHVFYKMLEDGVEGILYHRSLSESGTLTDREVVDATTGATASNEEHWFVMVAPPVAWQDGSNHNVMVVYRDTDNKLYSSVVTNDGSPGTPKAASDNTARASPGGTDSGQPTAALAIDGDDIYLHYADLSTGDLFRDKNTNNGSWDTDIEEEDNANIYCIRSHVFTHSAGNGGATVVGYTYENDPVADGGLTGFIWYGEYEIPVSELTVSLNTLQLQSNILDINVSPGATTILQDTLSLQAFSQPVTVSIPVPQTVNINTLLLQSVINNIVISPEAVSTTLNTLSLQSSVIDIDIVAAAVSTILDTLLLNVTINDINVSPSAVFTSLDTLLAQLTANDLSVLAGASSISANTLSIIATALDLDVTTPVTIVVESLLLNALANNAAVSPDAVSTALNTLLLQSIISDINMQAGASSLLLDTLLLNALSEDITLSPAAVSILVDTLLLNSIVNDVAIALGESTIAVNTLLLQSVVNNSAILAGTATTFLDTLLLQALAQTVNVSPSSVTSTLDTLLVQSFANDSAVVAGEATISADALSLEVTSNSISISPSAVSTGLDTLLLQSVINNITIAIGASTIPLNTLLLSSSTPNITVTPDTVSIQLGSLELSVNTADLDVVIDVALTVALNTLSLLSSSQAITVSPSATSIAIDTLLLEANANNIDVLLGAVSIILDTLSANTTAINLNVSPGAAISQMDTLLLNAIANDLSISPAAVSQLLDTLLLQSIANEISVVAGGTTINADTLSLLSNILDVEISPGAVTTTLDTLLLQGNANNITVSTVFPTVIVDTLALETNAVTTAIAPAATTLSLDTLLLDANILDIIAQIVIQTVSGGVAISDSLISDILLSDELISNTAISDSAISDVMTMDSDNA